MERRLNGSMLLSICMGCLMQLAVVLAGCFLYMDFFVVCTVILAAFHFCMDFFVHFTVVFAALNVLMGCLVVCAVI